VRIADLVQGRHREVRPELVMMDHDWRFRQLPSQRRDKAHELRRVAVVQDEERYAHELNDTRLED
jgi:hypothetical protein